MKYIYVLSALLFAQISLAGSSVSKEVLDHYLDFKNQVSEILQIENTKELNRRWTGLVNRANSEPWKSSLTDAGIDTKKLFQGCHTHQDSDGNTWCDGLRVSSLRTAYGNCPSKEILEHHEKSLDKCETTRGDHERCVDNAKSALRESTMACIISNWGSTGGGSNRAGRVDCPASGGPCKSGGCQGPCHGGTGKCNC